MTMNASESYTPDRLLAGDNADLITSKVTETLVSGQNLARGTALGKITATGKLTALVSGASDGSQAIYGILAAACDASGGDKTCDVYLAGEFNSHAVVFNGSDTAATFRTAARLLHIFFCDPVVA